MFYLLKRVEILKQFDIISVCLHYKALKSQFKLLFVNYNLYVQMADD